MHLGVVLSSTMWKQLSGIPETMTCTKEKRPEALTTIMTNSISAYRKVPDKLIANAKAWAQQYPEEIEFPEGYFGLLLSRLEYAQAHDQRNEQRRLFKEMKSVAEKTDYSEYEEESDMLGTIKMLQQIYGYH